MRHRYTATQWLPWPVDLVFAFFADPGNLPRLLPPWQKPRIDFIHLIPPPPGPTPNFRGIAAGSGSKITLSFRPVPLSPFRLLWDAHIAEFVWNDHFCDEQQHGPFAYWRHCHHACEESRQGRSGTLVTDQVTYEMKLGRTGELANALGGAAQLRALFAYRQRRVAAIFSRRTGSQAE